MTANPKQLPNDVDAEQALLGALVGDGQAFWDLPSTLKPEDFYRTQHRRIFAAIAALASERQPIDTITICAQLKQTPNGLEEAGGAAYVAGLPDLSPSSASIGFYADRVLDAAARRRFVVALGETETALRDESVPVKEALLRFEQALVADTRLESRLTAKDSARRFVNDLRAREDGASVERGLVTGLPSVDRELFVHPTDFVVLGGRPGDGKSVFLWQIARHIAGAAPVLFVSLEMNEQELAARAAMDIGDLWIADVRKPRNDSAMERLIAAIDEYSRLDITFIADDDPTVILREAVRMKRKRGLALLVVDYLQLVDIPREWGENRDQRIGQLTRRLKRFANDFRVPVLAAAQVKRIDHLQKGRDPRPGLEDLRESGNIEQDANAVVFVYRPGMVAGTDEERDGDKRTTELLIAKQRGGAAGTRVPLVAQFEHARFREPIHPEPDAQQTMGFGR